jgi:hypothetical protein
MLLLIAWSSHGETMRQAAVESRLMGPRGSPGLHVPLDPISPWPANGTGSGSVAIAPSMRTTSEHSGERGDALKLTKSARGRGRSTRSDAAVWPRLLWAQSRVWAAATTDFGECELGAVSASRRLTLLGVDEFPQRIILKSISIRRLKSTPNDHRLLGSSA